MRGIFASSVPALWEESAMLLDIIKYGPIDLSLGPIFGVWEALVVRKPSLCWRSLRITNLCCDLQD